MSRIIKAVHIALTVISWGIFVLSLIRFAVVWNALPDRLGVHFSENGEFDVIGSKSYAAYPYIVSVAALVFCEISVLLSKKIKTGLKTSEKGSVKIRTSLILLLDVIKLGFSFFFSGVWADCVIRQRPLNTAIPAALMLIMLLTFCVFVIALIVIMKRNPPESS